MSRCIFFLASAAILAAIDITPNRLPLAMLGKAYQGGPLVAYGGGPCPQNSISMRVVAGELPEGLTLTPSGNFYGLAQSPGIYQFVVRAENACSWVDREFTLEVGGAAAIQVNPSALEFRVIEGQPLPGAVSVRVSSNPPGQAYTLEPTGVDWMEARSRSGATPGRGAGLEADTIDVFIDSARLPVGTHRALLRLSAWRAVESPVVPVTIQVLPAPRFQPSAPPVPPESGAGFRPMMIEAGPPPGLGADPHAAPGTHGSTHAAPPGVTHIAPSGASHAVPHSPPVKKPAKPAVKTASTRSAPAGRLSRVASLKTRPRPPAPAHAAENHKPSPVGKPLADGHGKDHAAPAKEAGHTQQASHSGAKPHQEEKGHGEAKPAAKKDEHKPAEHKDKAAGHGDAKSHETPKKEAAHKEAAPKETAHKEQPKKDAHAPAKGGHD